MAIQKSKEEWKNKFIEKASTVHKRKLPVFADKMMRRTNSWKNSLVSRSKKHNVECFVTVEELRQLLYDYYGTNCKYCGRVLTINNIVIDHITPLSKGGSSNLDNLQIICKTSNSMKGSLTENNFILLLEWLKSLPEELSKDISIRLSRGIR
jgi:5-methylcytosine-specific restriction endonuclease McrA